MNLNKNKKLIRYSTNWLWMPVTLILIGLIVPIFTAITVFCSSDTLRFQIVCYIVLNIFLLFIILNFKNRFIHMVVGYIFLFLALSFIFGYFLNLTILYWYSHFQVSIAAFIYLPLLCVALLLIFLPNANFSVEPYELFTFNRTFRSTIESPVSLYFDLDHKIEFRQRKSVFFSIDSDSSISLLTWNHEASSVYKIQSENLSVKETIFSKNSKVLEFDELAGLGRAFIGPDGMMYSYEICENIKDHKKFNTKSVALHCYDKKSILKWMHKVPFIENKTIELVCCFFDTKTKLFENEPNVYMILQKKETRVGELKTNLEYFIYVITSESKFLWQKDLQMSLLAPLFVPTGMTIKDRFLVVGENVEKCTTLQCISKDGNILWQSVENRKGNLVTPYAIDQNSNFIIGLNTNKSVLQSWDNTGKKVWEQLIDGNISTPPIIDSDNNIYIGVFNQNRSVYSFAQNGELRWKTVEPDPETDFYTPLIFSSNQTIYYLASGQNKLYCIQNMKTD